MSVLLTFLEESLYNICKYRNNRSVTLNRRSASSDQSFHQIHKESVKPLEYLMLCENLNHNHKTPLGTKPSIINPPENQWCQMVFLSLISSFSAHLRGRMLRFLLSFVKDERGKLRSAHKTSRGIIKTNP